MTPKIATEVAVISAGLALFVVWLLPKHLPGVNWQKLIETSKPVPVQSPCAQSSCKVTALVLQPKAAHPVAAWCLACVSD